MKYVFKAYSPIFPRLFEEEKTRLLSCITYQCIIAHVGSTAVEGLGGKGIIDIAIATSPEYMSRLAEQCLALGYLFRPSGSTETRMFFRTDLPDVEEGIRRYHVHLAALNSVDWSHLIHLRDYLRKHPEIASSYATLKHHAAHQARGDGILYRALKDPFLKQLLKDATMERSL